MAQEPAPQTSSLLEAQLLHFDALLTSVPRPRPWRGLPASDRAWQALQGCEAMLESCVYSVSVCAGAGAPQRSTCTSEAPSVWPPEPHNISAVGGAATGKVAQLDFLG